MTCCGRHKCSQNSNTAADCSQEARTTGAPDGAVAGAAEEVERCGRGQREGAARRRQRQRRQGAGQRPARFQQLLQAARRRQQAARWGPCTMGRMLLAYCAAWRSLHLYELDYIGTHWHN